MGVSVSWPLSVLYVCVSVCECVISNQSTGKKQETIVSDLSKLDTWLHKTHSKVLLALKYQGSTCVDPYHSVK